MQSPFADPMMGFLFLSLHSVCLYSHHCLPWLLCITVTTLSWFQTNNGQCVPCECNGRADTCDPTTGWCVDCRNNTAGKECEICAPTFYGTAMLFDCKSELQSIGCFEEHCKTVQMGSFGFCLSQRQKTSKVKSRRSCFL